MESLTSQIIIAFIFGVVFVTAMLLIVIKFPNPTPSQDRVFRIILSMAVAGVAAMIPGFISLEIDPNIGLLLRAGGAIAVFVLVYFYNPAKLVSDSPDEYIHKDQAAAICFRKLEGRIEYLLVKTTGGRWTFPKGKVENDEEMSFSAKREAFEEQGFSVVLSIRH